MRSPLIALLLCCTALAPAQTRIGRRATEAEIRTKDITVFPNGAGLPKGRGTAAAGANIYRDKCSECHNDNGEGRQGQYPALVGGKGSLATDKPVKTVGSFWPHATTIFDYVRRAMPYDQPRTLTTDQLYSVTAFLLFKNGIIGENEDITDVTLPKVRMPNRDGFVPDERPDVKAKR
jgi:cytochrome c